MNFIFWLLCIFSYGTNNQLVMYSIFLLSYINHTSYLIDKPVIYLLAYKKHKTWSGGEHEVGWKTFIYLNKIEMTLF